MILSIISLTIWTVVCLVWSIGVNKQHNGVKKTLAEAYEVFKEAQKLKEQTAENIRKADERLAELHPEKSVFNGIIKNGAVYVPQQSVENDGDICEQCDLWQKGCHGACNYFGKGLIMKEMK